MKRSLSFLYVLLFSVWCEGNTSEVPSTQAWVPVEMTFTAVQIHRDPFAQVALDVVITDPAGTSKTVPAFWAGGRKWKVRYASSLVGSHRYRTQCNEESDTGLHGVEGHLEVTPYTGDHFLYRHGQLQVARDRRHFQHADGTPFLWLADTWWKCLCQRMTWEGFQELTADRKAKGFNAVQIVCGPYPDETMMEARWENEGGMPYTKKDFSEVNPRYFEFADRRIRHLVEAGIVPVIVGGWGRPQGGGRSTLHQVGLEGFQRHWRHLVARYGAYPTVWIVGGEAKDDYGPWAELARYVREIDPYQHPLGYHAPAHPREAIKDNGVFDFDMVAIGHEGMSTAAESLKLMKSCQSRMPARPVLCGEACYEGHMQTNFQDIQRHLFWSFMLSGAAGHTYGAAGVWQASVEGDPGIDPVYDWTTWKEGMNYPGSAQLGLGRRFLEQYPWSRFEVHPEWAEEGCFAAGIPGEVRFIYLPKRNLYNWSGPLVKSLEPHINWRAFYFDPATGRRFDRGILKAKTQAGDAAVPPVEFRSDVPSPQDWILVMENARAPIRDEPSRTGRSSPL